jgi:predicted transcriptional regulator
LNTKTKTFGDYQYVVDEILKVLQTDNYLNTLQVAQQVHMSWAETYDWLVKMDEKGLVHKTRMKDTRFGWRKKA